MNRLFIVKADINGNPGILKDPFVGQTLGAGNAVFSCPGAGGLYVAVGLDAEYLRAQVLEGLPGLVVVDAVAP